MLFRVIAILLLAAVLFGIIFIYRLMHCCMSRSEKKLLKQSLLLLTSAPACLRQAGNDLEKALRLAKNAADNIHYLVVCYGPEKVGISENKLLNMLKKQTENLTFESAKL